MRINYLLEMGRTLIATCMLDEPIGGAILYCCSFNTFFLYFNRATTNNKTRVTKNK